VYGVYAAEPQVDDDDASADAVVSQPGAATERHGRHVAAHLAPAADHHRSAATVAPTADECRARY